MKTLNAHEKQKTTYAIPLWLRDVQIQSALDRKLPMLMEGPARDEPIALVGYGPSLNQTWEKVRDFRYVMSCSGSHPFLLERGIVPNWHAAVDPQPKHTVRLIGQPHPDVEYLISATCHPDVFDHLAEYKVRLWFVFDPSEEGIRQLPPGAWAVTGGCDVGLRMLTLSAFLGFRDLHVFGLDGSYGADGTRHAGAHPVPLPNAAVTTYEGVEYKTTPGMLEAARQTCHELDQLGPHITTTFYGEGLTQAMVKRRVPQVAKTAYAAVGKPELISAEYRALNAEMHRTHLVYGVGGHHHSVAVLNLVELCKSKNILDYGCGKGTLGRAIPWAISEYDPAIPGKDGSPKPADIVTCLDVLEHVEEDRIILVLQDLKRVVRQVGYFVIHTGPSSKTLPDGRNAHILQRHRQWWENRLRVFFQVDSIEERKPLLYAIVRPLPAKVKAPPVLQVVSAEKVMA